MMLRQLEATACIPNSFQVGTVASSPLIRFSEAIARNLARPAFTWGSITDGGEAATSMCPPSSAATPSAEPPNATTLRRFGSPPSALVTCAVAIWLWLPRIADREAQAAGIRFQSIHQVSGGPDRGLRAHAEHHELASGLGERGDVGVIETGAPGDVVGEHGRRGHHHVVAVARLLIEVGQRDRAAAAGLVHHRCVRVDQLLLGQQSEYLARRRVAARPRRDADDDLDALIGLPGARRERHGRWQHKEKSEKDCA